MDKKELKKVFGTDMKIADFFGIARPSVTEWAEVPGERKAQYDFFSFVCKALSIPVKDGIKIFYIRDGGIQLRDKAKILKAVE